MQALDSLRKEMLIKDQKYAMLMNRLHKEETILSDISNYASEALTRKY